MNLNNLYRSIPGKKPNVVGSSLYYEIRKAVRDDALENYEDEGIFDENRIDQDVIYVIKSKFDYQQEYFQIEDYQPTDSRPVGPVIGTLKDRGFVEVEFIPKQDPKKVARHNGLYTMKVYPVGSFARVYSDFWVTFIYPYLSPQEKEEIG